jgi:exopolyphosphatase / guanosine-5'-triphosphate,3'-diphosphate pyrophosphatase
MIIVVEAMTTQNDIKIVPRWEWRTFAASLDGIEDRIAAVLRRVEPRTSAEIYVLRLGGSQNAKIRNDVFDVKHLRQVDANGLELWEPMLKAKIPLSRSDLAAAFAELHLPPPKPGRETHTIEQFINELVAAQPQLRAARVGKSRRGFRFAGCTAEVVHLSVESLHLESFSLEHEQASCILEALRDLDLITVPNTNYPLALKRALGLEDEDRNYSQGA